MRELAADRNVLADAAHKAALRIGEDSPGRLEACAYELCRCYTVLERMLENICESFENHFERQGEWHEKLLQRMTLDLPGLRPAFFPAGHLPGIRDLKGFRHIVRHAYDLVLREDRMRELVQAAEQLAAALPELCKTFERSVRREQGW